MVRLSLPVREFLYALLINLLLLFIGALLLFIYGGISGDSLTISLGPLVLYRLVNTDYALSVETGNGLMVLAFLMTLIGLLGKRLWPRSFVS